MSSQAAVDAAIEPSGSVSPDTRREKNQHRRRSLGAFLPEEVWFDGSSPQLAGAAHPAKSPLFDRSTPKVSSPCTAPGGSSKQELSALEKADQVALAFMSKPMAEDTADPVDLMDALCAVSSFEER